MSSIITSGKGWATVPGKDLLVPANTAAISWQTGIDGNAHEMYRLTYQLFGDGSFSMMLNNDSSNKYSRQIIRANNNTAEASNAAATSSWALGASDGSTTVCGGVITIFPMTGRPRFAIGVYTQNAIAQGATSHVAGAPWVYSETAANIERMDFAISANNILAGSQILLERKVR